MRDMLSSQFLKSFDYSSNSKKKKLSLSGIYSDTALPRKEGKKNGNTLNMQNIIDDETEKKN